MHSSLLEILAEPGTGAPLALHDSVIHDGLIEAGTLQAPSGKKYPIVRGIPRFVEVDNYTKSFGQQWNRFRDVQLDSLTRCHRSEKRFDTEAVIHHLATQGVDAYTAPTHAALLEIIAENTAGETDRPQVVVFFTNGSFDGIIGRYVKSAIG